MTPTQLRSTRRQLGLTQAELAELLGLKSRIIRYYEMGEQAIPGRIGFAMAWLKMYGTTYPWKDGETAK